ncbi:HAD-IIA family hydrolase [Mycolicibacterium gadium]|nr:HAD-IIA family hydrolase [Mycolicibacterium gadium]
MKRESAIGAESLVAQYVAVICDLDGVVYRGATPVPGAVETLNRLSAQDIPVVFATNNASRSPDAVVAHLHELGVGPDGWTVVTSSQAAAAYLAARLPEQTVVLAVGGPGVVQALTDVGLVPVRASELAGATVAAVVQGLGVDVTWTELAEVGYHAEAGATWVVTNLDIMLPTSRGRAPGNGALVAAVQAATTVIPHVVGKPGPNLFDLARSTMGTEKADTLVCGDRLDTDIEGANAAGLDSLLVLTGASDLKDLAFAAPSARPTYVTTALSGLLEPGVRLRATPEDGVSGRSLRSVVTATWAALDAGQTVPEDTGMWRRLERQLGLERTRPTSSSPCIRSNDPGGRGTIR